MGDISSPKKYTKKDITLHISNITSVSVRFYGKNSVSGVIFQLYMYIFLGVQPGLNYL
jgi:hypothetical protein